MPPTPTALGGGANKTAEYRRLPTPYDDVDHMRISTTAGDGLAGDGLGGDRLMPPLVRAGLVVGLIYVFLVGVSFTRIGHQTSGGRRPGEPLLQR